MKLVNELCDWNLDFVISVLIKKQWWKVPSWPWVRRNNHEECQGKSSCLALVARIASSTSSTNRLSDHCWYGVPLAKTSHITRLPPALRPNPGRAQYAGWHTNLAVWKGNGEQDPRCGQHPLNTSLLPITEDIWTVRGKRNLCHGDLSLVRRSCDWEESASWNNDTDLFCCVTSAEDYSLCPMSFVMDIQLGEYCMRI